MEECGETSCMDRLSSETWAGLRKAVARRACLGNLCAHGRFTEPRLVWRPLSCLLEVDASPCLIFVATFCVSCFPLTPPPPRATFFGAILRGGYGFLSSVFLMMAERGSVHEAGLSRRSYSIGRTCSFHEGPQRVPRCH